MSRRTTPDLWLDRKIRATTIKPGGRNIATWLRRKIWGMACVICEWTGDTEADHIIPASKGGTNDESNIQPLCHQCNMRKHNRKTNEELRAYYLANKEEHDLRNRYRMETRYLGFGAHDFWFWKRQVAEAKPLEQA